MAGGLGQDRAAIRGLWKTERNAILRPMTKVQITFPLTRPLTDSDWNRIAHMHSVYGFNLVRLKPSGDALFVEYDASRLSPKEVRGSLEQNGLPVGIATPPPEPPKPENPAG